MKSSSVFRSFALVLAIAAGQFSLKVARAHASLSAMRSLSQADVDRIVAAMSRAAVPEASRLAEAANRPHMPPP